MVRSLAVLSAALLFVAPPAARAEPPLVVRAADGDAVLFAVTIPRPADMGRTLLEQDGLYRAQGAGAARVPELFASPAWRSPAYVETGWPDYSEMPARLDTVTFVGRCPAAESASYTLRYPRDAAGWATVNVSVDLKGASAGDLASLRERFGKAQAAHFGMMGSGGDLGGFWAYAEQVARRRAGLDARTDWSRRGNTRDDPTERIYSLTTGALAVQESLQLDRMNAAAAAAPAPRTVKFADIKSVAVKSHPFDEMRKGREPAKEPLAEFVPEDNYYVRFTSVPKFLDALDYSEKWGTSLLRLASATGTDFETRGKLLRQLGLPPESLARLLGPAIVTEIAVTGSDPFLRMGSDVTLIIQTKNWSAFGGAMPSLSPPDVPFPSRDTSVDDVTIHGFTRASVSSYRAHVGNTVIIGNWEAGVRRVILAALGKAPRLSDAPDFKYMRAAVFPYDPAKEDGFIYLSDAFIRRLTGPEVRIKQRRRLEAAASLGILNNARLLHGYEFGPGTPAMEDLVKSGCLDPKDLFDPEGGSFTLDAESGAAASSAWSAAHFLKPLIEVEGDSATEDESKEYDQFRRQYQQYWRRYFDPIGMRLTVGDTIKVETHILPLIDTSAYNDLKDLAGGAPISVDLASFPARTLLRFSARFGEGQLRQSAMTMLFSISGTNLASDWLGDWVTVWVEDSEAYSTLVRKAYRREEGDGGEGGTSDEILDIFNISLVAGVHCKNKVSLATFLVGLKAVIESAAPNTVVFTTLEPYQGTTIVKIAPDPSGTWARDLKQDAERAGDAPPPEPAIYYATIGDGWYISTQASALRNLVDAQARAAGEHAARPETREGNALVYASLSSAESWRSGTALVLEGQARRESLSNMKTLLTLGRCGALTGAEPDAATRRLFGCRLVCPDGGSYRYDPGAAEVVSTVHGPLHDPKSFDAPPDGSPLAGLLSDLKRIVASLKFTEDGVETTVEIMRR